MFPNKSLQYLLAPLGLIFIFLASFPVTSNVLAAGPQSDWEAYLQDSLFSLAAEAMYPIEPSIQEILDNLGYDIDAENDILDMDLFCLFPQSTWRLIAEYSGAAETHASGWYTSMIPGDTHTVITGDLVPGDSVILGGGLSGQHGLFHRRDAGTTWYTEIPLNYDNKGHHRVYALPDGNGYIIFWEDLGWVTDGDYNDMVFEIRPTNLAPQIGVDFAKLCGGACPPRLICEGDSVCLEIWINDPGCFGDTVTVEMVVGEGIFDPVVDVGEFSVVHCWTPIWEGSKQFIFRATDNLGLWTQREFWAVIAFDHDPPVLPAPYFGQVTACLPERICVDFPIEDTTYTEIWINPIGFYDEGLQEVCFDADTVGVYTLWVVAADTCENIDSTYLQITVGTTSPPTIIANPDNYFDICDPESLCVVFSTYDADDDIVLIWTDPPGVINLTDSTICFVAAETGTYQIPVYVIDACGNADTAQVNFIVTGGGGVSLQCPGSIDTVLCADGELCFPITVSNPNAAVNVSPIGTYNSQTGEVCFTTNGDGTYDLRIIAESDCGADTCDVSITVTINNEPTAVLPADYQVFDCEPTEICVPYSCSDPENNLASCVIIEAPPGYVDKGTEVCFTPTDDGSYRIIIEAVDECGLSSRDTIYIDVTLNDAPVITGDEELSIGLCAPDSICLEFKVSDIDGNIVAVSASPNAAINMSAGLVCFYADVEGVHNVRIIATDECGAADTLDITITVTLNDNPKITCPDPLDTLLCEPSEICFDLNLPVVAGGLEVDVQPVGYYNDLTDKVCFDADTAGVFELTVTVTDTCGGQGFCTAQITVSFNNPPEITGQSTFDYNICAPEEICFPVSCSDIDDNLTACELISGPGSYDGAQICFTPPTGGTYYFTVRATDECGLTAQFQITVTVNIDERPVITAQADTSMLLCEPDEVCVKYVIYDPEDGQVTVTANNGVVNEADSTLCLYFTSDSSVCVDLIATDACGNADTANICFDIDLNQKPEIIVDAEFTKALCDPGEICFPVQIIEPEGIRVTIVKPFGAFSGDYSTFCFDADTAGIYEMTLIVTDTCLVSDTAIVRVTVEINSPPVLTVPADQEIFFCQPGQQVCITGISVADAEDNLAGVELTAGEGMLDLPAGEFCFTADTAGFYCFEFTATDDCAATDVKGFCVTMQEGVPPVITLDPTIDVDLPGPGEICFPVRSDDADVDQLFDLSLLSGAGVFPSREGWNTIEAEHCFWADTAGCYPFIFESIDSCGLFDYDSTLVCVTITPPDTGFRICVDTVEALNGMNVEVAVIVYQALEMGGFDLLICFDPSALAFNHVTAGPAIEDWEYFTYRATSPNGCVSPCNVTAVHLIGFADMNDGSPHPPEEAYIPLGDLAYLNFFVTEDRNFIGQCVPLNFCWYDCTDNAISSRTGDTTYLAYDIDDILPGADCVASDKPFLPLPAIDFCDGRICIIPPPDDRGDINLNGIANEIADAVLFTNYFILGPIVWDPVYYQNQWLATDVNDDGITRSIADLVYLIRIITGDAEPFPASGEGKPDPFGESVVLETRQENGELIITSHAPVELGGLFLRLTGDLTSAGPLHFGPEVTLLPPRYRKSDSELRILLAGMEQGAIIPDGPLELARFTVPESGNSIQIVEAEAATYLGRSLGVEFLASNSSMPQKFELAQNYPNPFNAQTVIQLTLPHASDYRITIYDVTGRKVRTFAGTAESGLLQITWNGESQDGTPVSSGIYFYRATAGEFSASRKMILMK